MKTLKFWLWGLFLAFIISTQALAGTWTTNEFVYKPGLGARGAEEKARFDSGVDRLDARLGKEIWVGDPKYGSTLQAAVTAIGGSQAVLRVPAGTHNIATDLTIPANVTLKPERGAVLNMATTKTLTVNGWLEAGLYQIFSWAGTGKVVFGHSASIQAVYPEWWGAKGDGATDDTLALQAALTAGSFMAPVKLTSRYTNYCFTTSLVFPANGGSLYGDSWHVTGLKRIGGAGPAIWGGGAYVQHAELRDFGLNCNGQGTDGIDFSAGFFSQSRMRGVDVRSAPNVGIKINGNASYMEDVKSFYNGDAQFELTGGMFYANNLEMGAVTSADMIRIYANKLFWRGGHIESAATTQLIKVYNFGAHIQDISVLLADAHVACDIVYFGADGEYTAHGGVVDNVKVAYGGSTRPTYNLINDVVNSRMVPIYPGVATLGQEQFYNHYDQGRGDTLTVDMSTAKSGIATTLAGLLASPANIKGMWFFDTWGVSSTVTDRSSNCHNMTLSGNGRLLLPNPVGNLPSLVFGASDYWQVDDHADFSFGDGAGNDSAFSVVVLVNPAITGDSFLAAKLASTTGSPQCEYGLEFNSSKIAFALYKQDASAYIGRKFNTALTGDVGAWHTYIATYNGNKTAAAIKIYRDGVQVDDTNYSSGSYTGMTNGTARVADYILNSGGAIAYRAQGRFGFASIIGEELTAAQVKQIDAVLKGALGNY